MGRVVLGVVWGRLDWGGGVWWGGVGVGVGGGGGIPM